MKHFERMLYYIFICAGLICMAAAPSRAQESIDGKFDIALLMKEAGVRYDLSKEDAIILLDSEKIRLAKDGRYTKYVHRIIWINSDVAIGRYGDHRVAYDAKNCKLNVETVRTWRDNKWWETKSSGIVETMPDNLAEAYDYSNVRETMLLHDGIELPCILEVAYSIEDKEPFRRGWDGSWTFQRPDPAIKSWFSFELPTGWWPNIKEQPALPIPKKTTDDETGLDTYSWQRGPFDPLPYPEPKDPSETEAYIIWSTWKDWSSLGAYLRSNFDAAAVGDAELKEQLDSLLDGLHTDRQKARAIAGYVNDKTKYIDYPWTFWISNPRPAVRVFSSAYGHAYDRAVLAAALFAKAKIGTLPVFLSPIFGDIDVNVPGTASLSEFGLWLSGENLAAFYDPVNSEIESGPIKLYSRMAWRVGADEKPEIRIRGMEKISQNDISIELKYDKESKKFIGSGFFYADNYFAPYLAMAGLKDEALSYLGELISSIFENAKITGYNPSDFSLVKTIFGFQFEFDKPEPDNQGRIPILLGESNDGILANMPDDIKLYHNMRTLPIKLPCIMNQKIELNLKLDDLNLIHTPQDDSLENDAGMFSIRSKKWENKLTVTRVLNLTKADYAGDDWLSLRALFLADRNEGNRLILLED